MPKYWGKQYFSFGSFPEVGQKQKTEKKKYWGKYYFPEVGQKTEKKKKIPKVVTNNGQLRIATPPRVAHAKPPGPK